jgi:hypothetical protein
MKSNVNTKVKPSLNANTVAIDKSAGVRNHQTLLKMCLILLHSEKIFCYANNTGSIKGVGRYQVYGFIGSPDILGILPNGQYLGIEIKTGSAMQNKNQKKFQKKIVDNNGEYWIIHSLDELKERLNG